MVVPHVQPGDDLLNRFGASVFNQFADAANTPLDSRMPGAKISAGAPWVQNDSDVVVNEFQAFHAQYPLFVDDPDQYGDFLDTQSILGSKPASGLEYGEFVISASQVAVGGLGRIYRGPIVPALVDIDLAWHTRCDVQINSHNLQSKVNGSAQILWRSQASGNDTRCLIRQGCLQDISVQGKTLFTVAPDTSTSIQVWRGHPLADATDIITDVRFYSMHGDQEISAGKFVDVKFYAIDKEWRIVGAECEDV